MSFSYLRAFSYTTSVLTGYKKEPSGTFESRGVQAPYFLPPGLTPKQSSGLLLLIHGMAARGTTDPRLHVAASSLARNGFVVVAPHYPEIADLVVDPVSIDQIVSDIQMAVQKEEWGMPEKIGIVSASFSGSLSIVAACNQKCSDFVSGIMSVGPFGNARELLKVMFSQKKTDPYGFYIVMKNFLFPEGHPLRQAFDHAAKDNGLGRKPLLPAYLKSLSTEDQKEFEQALYNADYRKKRWEEVSVQPRATGMMDKVNAVDYLDGLQAPLFLLHGRADAVVPATESKRLYNKCRELNKPVQLVVTDLISHGTPQVRFHTPVQIHSIVSLVADFFRCIEKAS